MVLHGFGGTSTRGSRSCESRTREVLSGGQCRVSNAGSNTGVRTLGINVMAYEAACAGCGFEFWWVFGLLPAYRPAPEEFTTTDFPEAVDLARRILADPEGDTQDIARQLVDRPAWQKGRGFNPNRCSGCGEHADWHRLEGIITEAYHCGETRAAYGRVPVTQWRAIRGCGAGIQWPVTS